MTLLRPALVAAMVLASLPLAPVAGASDDAPATEIGTDVPAPMTKGEQRLAKLLQGRVAGEPTRCIRVFPSQRMQTIDGTAYVYGSGTTIFVQRTRNPEQIDDTDALITNRFNGTQLCSFDVTTTVNRYNGFFTGAVFFEEFVPYTRTKPAAEEEG